LYPHSIPDLSKQLPGRNVFGTLLMDLRPDIDSICYTPGATVDCVDLGSHVVILHDGELMTKPNRRGTGPVHSMSVPKSHALCFHCGVKGHTARVCRLKHKEVRCYSCNTVGHKKRYCPFSNCNSSQLFVCPTRTRAAILPTPVSSFSTNGPNYGHNFPPLPSQSHSLSHFR